jgi:signal transduction histidine kinase
MDDLHTASRVDKTIENQGQPDGKTAAPVPLMRRWSVPFITRHRNHIWLGAFAALVLLEVIEHILLRRFGQGAHIAYDALVYIILVPASLWLLLNLLEKTETERVQAAREIDLRSQFSQRLGDAITWDELITTLVEYPHRIAPGATITLFVFQPGLARLQAEATCSSSGEIVLKPDVSISPDSLPLGSLPQILLQNSPYPPPPASAPPPLPPHRYDLSITRGDQQFGVLKLDYPLGRGPSLIEQRMLKSVAPVMALAIEAALLQNLAANQAAASEAQRQHIAQNLHDTLAQNIGYLRLKLDQLTGENAIREIGAVLQELERMRSTADEAYQQVRNTLDELNPVHAEDLLTSLTKQASAICGRSGMTLRSDQVGDPYPLPPAVRQQIMYIVREALHNIEKHASACKVYLQFVWLENELIIKIDDDGVGFNPLSVPDERHYGLWIMQQRAQEIGGTLKVASVEGGGTEVTLWTPRQTTPTMQAGGSAAQ